MLAAFPAFPNLLCLHMHYIHFLYMQCIHTHTHIDILLPVVFLLCNMAIYFCCLCTLGKSSQSERSWCCYRLNTWISVDDKAVVNFFQLTFPLLTCQLDAFLQSCAVAVLLSVPWYKLFTAPLLVLNWWGLKDYQDVYKAHALKFRYFVSSLRKSFMISKNPAHFW